MGLRSEGGGGGKGDRIFAKVCKIKIVLNSFRIKNATKSRKKFFCTHPLANPEPPGKGWFSAWEERGGGRVVVLSFLCWETVVRRKRQLSFTCVYPIPPLFPFPQLR